MVQSAFSYLGTEIVALTAGEAENVSTPVSTTTTTLPLQRKLIRLSLPTQPRRNVPKAIRRTFFRIVLFYFIGTLRFERLLADRISLSGGLIYT